MAGVGVYSVATVYEFKTNARQTLSDIARLAERAEATITSLSSAVVRADESFAAFVATAERAKTAMAQVARSSARAAEATGLIGNAAQEAAAKVLDGTTIITRRLGAVTRAANRSTAALTRVGVAASGVGGGVGGIGGGGSGGGGRRGGSGAAASHGAITPGTIGGLGALAFMGIGIKGAADLQDKSIQTGIALGKDNGYVDKNLVPLAMQMSMKTAQSVTDSMGLLRVMATSGLNDPQTMRALAMPIAQFADTQFLGTHHVPFDQSVAQIASLSHELGLRTADQLKPFLSTAFKISQDMPDSLAKAMTQIKYYGGTYTAAGVAPGEILQLQATADRLGFGAGKSGTGFNQIYRNVLEASSDKMFSAQVALGIRNKNGSTPYINAMGQFDPERLFSDLNKRYEHARETKTVDKFDAEMQRAFTSNAALIATIMSSTAGRTQRAAVNATMGRVQGLEESQARLMSSLNAQTTLLASNFKTLATVIAGPLLGPLTHIVGAAATGAGNAALFLSDHPAAAAAAATALGAASIYGVYQLWKLIGGVYAFGHAAAHAAKESIGFGVGTYVPRHGGGAVRGAEAAFEGAGDAALVADAAKATRFGRISEVVAAAATGVASRSLIMRAGRAVAGPVTGAAASGFGRVASAVGRNEAVQTVAAVGKFAGRFAWIAVAEKVAPLLLRVGLGVVGLASGITEVLFALDVARHLPMIAIQVATWWTQNSGKIQYTIGFAFGSIARFITDAVDSMMRSAGSAITYLMQHPQEAIFGDMKGAMAAYAAAQAANQDPRDGAAMRGAGWADAIAGASYGRSEIGYHRGAPSVIQAPLVINVHTSSKDPRAHGALVGTAAYDALSSAFANAPSTASSGSGASRGSANFPRLNMGASVPAH